MLSRIVFFSSLVILFLSCEKDETCDTTPKFKNLQATEISYSKFTISGSGVLSFSSAPDYESPSDSGSNNVFNVSVAVFDGVNSSSVALVISLADDTSDNYGIRLPAQVALAELKGES